MENNEAVERLRLYAVAFHTERQGFLDTIEDALAAERKATVERIRAIVSTRSAARRISPTSLREVLAILDAQVAR